MKGFDSHLKRFYNPVSSLTAKCVAQESWHRGEYPELEIGRVYTVKYIGVQKSCSNIILEEIEGKEYDTCCFDLFEDGEPLCRDFTQEERFWAPYLRLSHCSVHSEFHETDMINYAIPQHLESIEQKYDVKVLYAVESGSRAWGFESEDSDWDVRFIYVHKPEWYLKVEEQRDVIEQMCSNDVDLVGWELRKALGLFWRSNPSLLEWIHAPKIYYMDQGFIDRLKEVEGLYFNPVKCMYHYNSIYNKQNQRVLSKNGFTLKKFLYYLRGVLACRWIEERGTLPPVRFLELADATISDSELREKIDELINLKKSSKEHDKMIVSHRIVSFSKELDAYYNNTIGQFRPEINKSSADALDSILYDYVLR